MGRYRHSIKSARDIIHHHFSEHLIVSDDIQFVNAQQWKQAAGDTIAKHATPLYVERGVLVVETKEATWNHVILLHSNRIIDSLRAMDNLSVNSIKIKLTHDRDTR